MSVVHRRSRRRVELASIVLGSMPAIVYIQCYAVDHIGLVTQQVQHRVDDILDFCNETNIHYNEDILGRVYVGARCEMAH